MKSRRVSSVILPSCLAALLTVGGSPAFADVVYLKNGDRLTGSVIEIEGGDLFFDSDLADTVEISVGDIESIETTKTIMIEREDGTTETGFIVRDEDGSMYVRPGEGGEVVDEQLEITDADRTGTEFDLGDVHHAEEAMTYFNYTANLDVGLTAATGNSDQSTFNMSAGFAPNFGKNHIDIRGQLNQAENDGDTTASNWRIQNRYERDLTQKWFAAGILDFENDDLADLNLRTSVAPGMGYRFFEGSPTDLKVFLGPAFISENYRGSVDDDDYLAALWRLDFEQDLYTSDVQFYHNHRLTAGITEEGFLALTTTGLKFDLISNLELLLELQFDWNSEPAEGASEDDERYLVKLRYSFEGDENVWFE